MQICITVCLPYCPNLLKLLFGNISVKKLFQDEIHQQICAYFDLLGIKSYL